MDINSSHMFRAYMEDARRRLRVFRSANSYWSFDRWWLRHAGALDLDARADLAAALAAASVNRARAHEVRRAGRVSE